MATISDGYLGGFSGSLGPVVGYQWRGRWCMRAKPQMVKNPRTEAQQRHRSLFREEVRLAARMNRVVKQTMAAPSLEAMMTPCNYFIHRNQGAFGWSSALGHTAGFQEHTDSSTLASLGSPSPSLGDELNSGRLTVDWERLVLSEGPVAPVEFGMPVVTDRTRLKISFEKNPLHLRADKYDRVYLYVYCPDAECGFLPMPVYRITQEISVLLPSSMAGREVHLWGLVQDDRGHWSNSVYIGHGPLENTVEEGVNPVDDTKGDFAASTPLPATETVATGTASTATTATETAATANPIGQSYRIRNPNPFLHRG